MTRDIKINKTEKDKCMDCIKSLSRLDGLTMALGRLSNREHIGKEIDMLMQYFEELLEDYKNESIRTIKRINNKYE